MNTRVLPMLLVCLGLASATPALAQDAPPTATPPQPEAAHDLRNPFVAVFPDFKHFFSKDTGLVLAVSAPAIGWAFGLDDHLERDVPDSLNRRTFAPGNVIGNVATQLGAGIATWAIGKASDRPKVQEVGGHVVRAAIVSQAFVQAGKVLTHRTRPDGSNDHSFPSGHAASAFATASVLQRHFGWKVGLPASAVGVYVAAGRMAYDKHHLSDVVAGAVIGVMSGRTVTMKVARHSFAVGLSPTAGGAAVLLSRR